MGEGTGAAIYEIKPAGPKPAAGALLALLNDSGVDRLIGLCVLRTITPASAACAVNVGIAPARNTSASGLIAAASVAAPGFDDSQQGQIGADVWPAGQYLTVSKASGAAGVESPLVAHLILRWISDVVNSEGLPA